MKVTQISVFLENKNGRLAEVAKIFGREGIDLKACTIADTADFGILRLIVDKPKEALAALLAAGFTAKETQVLAVAMADEPGGFAKVLEVFESNGVNIEYLYSMIAGANGRADVVFKVEDLDRGLAIQKEYGLDGPIDL